MAIQRIDGPNMDKLFKLLTASCLLILTMDTFASGNERGRALREKNFARRLCVRLRASFSALARGRSAMKAGPIVHKRPVAFISSRVIPLMRVMGISSPLFSANAHCRFSQSHFREDDEP